MASGQTYQPRNFIVLVSCITITSCFSECDINITVLSLQQCVSVIITLQFYTVNPQLLQNSVLCLF